jgi:hypothetical protein
LVKGIYIRSNALPKDLSDFIGPYQRLKQVSFDFRAKTLLTVDAIGSGLIVQKLEGLVKGIYIRQMLYPKIYQMLSDLICG